MAEGYSAGETSDRYEFDAPSHVVDFKELEQAESDDKWFEQQVEGVHTQLSTPSRPDWPFARNDVPNLPRAVVTPQVKTDVDAGPGTSTSPPRNIVTSWGPDSQRTRTTAPNQPPAQPCRVSKRKEAARCLSATSAAPPPKRNKANPAARPQRRSSGVRRRSAQLHARTSLRRSGRQNSKTAAASTPANTGPCSSEELELQRIRDLQKEVALHRRKNEASYRAALAGNPPPKKPVLSMTVPKEFHFSTETRVKAAAPSSTAHKEVDFISQLRKPSSPAKTVKGATVPKPFNLSSNKRKVEQPEAYIPMAQKIEHFQKRTPERYHLRSRQNQERGPSPVKGEHLKLTQPHTPHLMTRQRARPTTVKSTAELEAEEADKLQKFKFKALELNKKILQSVDSLKKPAVKEPTVPEGFELQIEKRLQERAATKKPQEGEEKPPTFKSQPLPKNILEGVVGLPEKKVVYPTVPESPAFALKNRIRMDRKVEEVKQPLPVKAHHVPHFGLPFQPQLPQNHHVEVCPFSFEERERERRALKEKRLEEMRNEEVPQFKAQLLPNFDSVVLPEKKKLEPTKPEPFKLLIDERGAMKGSRWEQMVKEEQKQQEEAALFKARPNTVTFKEPFQPKKESRAAVGTNSSAVVEAFELSTERRARERQEFAQLVTEKETLRAQMEEQQRQEEEKREKDEITRLRQEQVHKARPIRHYKPVAVKKSEVPLTVPQSPNFSDRFRL
uniref:TPX2 microtubule nucleation factor n=1 Tax=Monopterus albus TaxID=43700 RepID=A0A3Q3JRD3_MONAL|nr:targeting protein for Xklp2 isoform X1 [Monopterus albus]